MKFRFIIISIFFILLTFIFGVLNYFKIQTQFYFWEILIDSKIILLLGLVFLLLKRYQLSISEIFKNCFHWTTSKNILFFCSILLPITITITFGNLFKSIEFNPLSNPETLILGIIFDIPAVFVFSMTSVFLEELFFRVFLPEIFVRRSLFFQSTVSALFWMMYSISEVITPELNIYLLITAMVYFFSFGLFLTLLAHHFKTVWFGYSLRIGAISLAPIILSSIIIESDTFFVSKNLLFSFEGIGTVIFFFGFSFLMFLKAKTINNIQFT